MQLSQEDILSIEKESQGKWQKQDFSEKIEEFDQLKNIDGHCIFYDISQKKCRIYLYRPVGCRFYPLIFNPDTSKCEFDLDCPHRQQFYRHRPEYLTKCKELRFWIENVLLKDVE